MTALLGNQIQLMTQNRTKPLEETMPLLVMMNENLAKDYVILLFCLKTIYSMNVL